MQDKTKQFWLSIKNLTTISSLISKKRDIKNQVICENNDFNKLNYSNTSANNLFVLNKYLQNKSSLQLVTFIFNDMYKFNFDSCSSVESLIQKNNYTMNQLDYLENINLLEHTLGVMNQMFEVVSKSYGKIYDYFIIAAMVHDFGKCKALRDHYNLDATNGHHKASAEYLDKKWVEVSNNIQKFDIGMLKLVSEAIRIHHDDKKLISFKNTLEINELDKSNELQNIILKFLKIADSNQRELELKKLGVISN